MATAMTAPYDKDGNQLELYRSHDFKEITVADRYGNPKSASATGLYDTDGWRFPLEDALGNPVAVYEEDGVTQVPLFDRNGFKITTDTPNPRAAAPEPAPPSTGEGTEQPDTPGATPGDTSPEDGGDGEDTSPEDTPATPPPAPGGDMPTVEDLQKFTPEDAEDAEQAEIMLNSAVAMVDAYTRGRHVNRAGELRPGVHAVILTTAARLLANPGQVSRGDTAGQFSTRRGPGFSGFTLAEQAVLNRYRKRAAG